MPNYKNQKGETVVIEELTAGFEHPSVVEIVDGFRVRSVKHGTDKFSPRGNFVDITDSNDVKLIVKENLEKFYVHE